MIEEEQDVLEEPEIRGKPESSVVPKERQSFKKVRRELTEEELSTTGAQRLILDEIDRLEEENNFLKGIQSKYHEADKKASLLEEKLKGHTALEILSSAALAMGSLAMGYAPKALAESHMTAGIFLVGGVVLIIGGITAKAVKG